MAERLRRWTANPLGSARVGSNPILVATSFFFLLSFFCVMQFVPHTGSTIFALSAQRRALVPPTNICMSGGFEVVPWGCRSHAPLQLSNKIISTLLSSHDVSSGYDEHDFVEMLVLFLNAGAPWSIYSTLAKKILPRGLIDNPFPVPACQSLYQH